MSPKPIPYPYRVGIDICSISRIQSIVDRHRGDHLLTWGSKIFNRLEWPHFLSKIDECNLSVGPETSNIFVQWLAGRWAAKEAAIKAHTLRKLHMRDVILLPSNLSKQSAPSGKPIALINPLSRMVLMSREVARKRGLRQEQKGYSFPNSEAGATSGWARWGDSPQLATQVPKQQALTRKEKVRSRNLLVSDKERQTADISISHDTDYAVAVCMAVDDLEEQDLEAVVDEGLGNAIHEPQWGDEGF